MKIFEDAPKQPLSNESKEILYKFKEDIQNNNFDNLYKYLNYMGNLNTEVEITEALLNLDIKPVEKLHEFYVLIPKVSPQLWLTGYPQTRHAGLRAWFTDCAQFAMHFPSEEKALDFLYLNDFDKRFNNKEEMINNFYIKYIAYSKYLRR